jgi:hypothetical protein
MAAEIDHDDDVGGTEYRGELLMETLPIDRAVENVGRDEIVVTQHAEKGECATVGVGGKVALPSGHRTAIQRVGRPSLQDRLGSSFSLCGVCSIRSYEGAMGSSVSLLARPPILAKATEPFAR